MATLNVGAPQTLPRAVVTTTSASPKKKLNLLFFFLVLGLAFIKDIIDLVCMGLIALGMGLTATLLGAVVGIPIAVVAWIISFIFGLFINFTITAYFFSTGQGVGRRLAIQSVGFIIELVPYVNLLPLTTITFLIASLTGNVMRAASKVVPNPVVRKVVSLASR